MQIAIRDAQRKDGSHIVGLVKEHAQSTGESSPLTADYVERYLESPASTILLATVGGNPAGLMSYSLRPDLYHGAGVCLIEELIVKEGLRNQGVGRSLMNELFTRLAGRACAEVSVAVVADNTGAIKFYRSHGLTEEALLLEMHGPLQGEGAADRRP